MMTRFLESLATADASGADPLPAADRWGWVEGHYTRRRMGMLITVTEKPSARHGVVRFETNRALTGMAHERYATLEDAWGERPPDLVARALLETGNAESVHVHGNQVTVMLRAGGSSAGMAEAITDLFIHYKPGVQPSLP
jgi:hypothetical protein